MFRAKLSELQRHLEYVRLEFEARRASAYPSLSERLGLRLDGIEILSRQAAALSARLDQYQASQIPAFDTWRQIFKDLRDLAADVQWLRIRELPSYLASTPDDHFVSNVLEALHQEIGLHDVHPVASLHQPHWFATHSTPPQYPLYFAPSSLATEPDELPLAFHEVGHVLFKLWAPGFGLQIETVVASTLARKAREVSAQSDPAIRADWATALSSWQRQAYGEVEEVVCDVVGTLLGGPAFVVASMVGLMAQPVNPFEHYTQNYPPLDSRMRMGALVLRRRGLVDSTLDRTEAAWRQVRALYAQAEPRWYRWLYDEQYLGGVAAAVEQYLVKERVQLYEAGCGGLREELGNGAKAIVDDARAYELWRRDLLKMLRRDYSSSS